jgi:hypothetical protein
MKIMGATPAVAGRQDTAAETTYDAIIIGAGISGIRGNGDPGDPGDRKTGEAAHRLPAQAELGRRRPAELTLLLFLSA